MAFSIRPYQIIMNPLSLSDHIYEYNYQGKECFKFPIKCIDVQRIILRTNSN
jgi:hypothetical protein